MLDPHSIIALSLNSRHDGVEVGGVAVGVVDPGAEVGRVLGRVCVLGVVVAAEHVGDLVAEDVLVRVDRDDAEGLGSQGADVVVGAGGRTNNFRLENTEAYFLMLPL